MNVIITICEGPHDTAFLYKILRHLTFKPYSEKIGNMSDLFKKYFISQVKEHHLEDVNLQNIKPPLPTILKKEETYFLLYPVGGDAKIKAASRIIEDFKKRKEQEEFFDESANYSLLFFYDADEHGIEKRVEMIKKSFSLLLDGLEVLEHKKIIATPLGGTGCFIFTKDTKTGRLEDILLPIMNMGNEDIFDDAQQYIDKHKKQASSKKATHFNNDKALIGIAGQLQRSGCANTVIIQHADYLSKEKIKNHAGCQEICTFLKEFIKP